MQTNTVLIPEKMEHHKEVANIKDSFLKTKIEVLLNNWCVQRTNNEFVFFKHFNSSRKGVINQLILSGNDFDGIYEFEIFGHDLKIQNVFNKEIKDLVIKIDSHSNYDLAVFNNKNNKLIYSKKNQTEESFWNEIAQPFSRLSTFDIVYIQVNDKVHTFDQQVLGELKFRKKINELIRFEKKNIQTIQFIQKKKQFYISRFDLGDEAFKNELLSRNLISEAEYQMFTSKNREKCMNVYKNMKKIEIL